MPGFKLIHVNKRGPDRMHYCDFTTASWRTNSPANILFVQPLVFACNKECIKLFLFLALCEGNPSVTGGFLSQRASKMNAFPSHYVIMGYLIQFLSTYIWSTRYDNIICYNKKDLSRPIIGILMVGLRQDSSLPPGNSFYLQSWFYVGCNFLAMP